MMIVSVRGWCVLGEVGLEISFWYPATEVVTTGSPHTLLSWVRLHRNRTYGGFIDAVCDKAFVIPCWFSLLYRVQSLHILAYSTLFFLILAETSSACIRFQAYFSAAGVPPPKVEGLDISTSAVKADSVGKAKQTCEMLGTALFCLSWTRYLGLAFLLLAVPLAYESVRRKIQKRVIYVYQPAGSLDHRTLKFWMQCKAMGSELVVGSNSAEMVLNACACTSVDRVIAEAPVKADLHFLEKHGIDRCVANLGQAQFVTDEVVQAARVLQLGDDGIARLVQPKQEQKKD